jgi:hypothetical protein
MLSVRPSVWQEVRRKVHKGKSGTHKSNYNVASSKLRRILKDDRLSFMLKGSGTDPYVVGVARLIHKVFVSPPGVRELRELSWEVETMGLRSLVVEKSSRPDQEEARITKTTRLVSAKYNRWLGCILCCSK